MAKAKGGAGRKITGVTSRKFQPNLQTVKTVVNGKIQTVKVCSRCIKAGKVTKA
jgi:large subunit ribosomal protein L28